MPARKSPLDIPAEIVALADTAPYWINPSRAAVLLAHFWPAIEAAVREQVADEIYAAIEAHHANDPEGYEGHHHRAGLHAAAKIALGNTTEETS